MRDSVWNREGCLSRTLGREVRCQIGPDDKINLLSRCPLSNDTESLIARRAMARLIGEAVANISERRSLSAAEVGDGVIGTFPAAKREGNYTVRAAIVVNH